MFNKTLSAETVTQTFRRFRNIIRIYSKAAKRINRHKKRNDGINSPLHSCYVYPKQRAVVVLSWSLHFVLLCGSWANASRIASGRGRGAGDVTDRGGDSETVGRRLESGGLPSVTAGPQGKSLFPWRLEFA
ncbi:hypothetical protein QQF64_019296 [Cirrhinus molitorella]|uniref:Uncharacterized protein n=1 Tax=Cirrhinus molitorella TaxID=172907 RepID=A0ABR3LGM4_9TELE